MGTDYEGHKDFRTARAGRTPMLYVGANDGMLHGFNASTGREMLAYVPRGVYANLRSYTLADYDHKYFVDGKPSFHGDATERRREWLAYRSRRRSWCRWQRLFHSGCHRPRQLHLSGAAPAPLFWRIKPNLAIATLVTFQRAHCRQPKPHHLSANRQTQQWQMGGGDGQRLQQHQ